jgi:hypothetical protein
MLDSTVQNNQASGWSYSKDFPGSPGGAAAGGGIYVGGGTASLTNVTISANTAHGGNGSNGGWIPSYGGGQVYVPPGRGGDGYGGGMFAEHATVSLHNCTVTSNSASGGSGAQGEPKGNGVGGGLFIDDFNTIACLDAFTAAHVLNNKADGDPNIHGSYTICP